MKMIKYPSIEQFRNIIHHINHAARFAGLDENGEVIYNNDPLPILTFQGTIKLHGTNAGVCFNLKDGLYAQSRKNVITPEKDNAGFATFVYKHDIEFNQIMTNIYETHKLHLYSTVSLYGEWWITRRDTGSSEN